MPGGQREHRRRYRIAKPSPTAKASLARIKAANRVAFNEVTDFVNGLRDDPRPEGTKPLRDEYEGWLSAPVCGKRYRVIWRVHEDTAIIELLRAGLRKNVYDDPPEPDV